MNATAGVGVAEEADARRGHGLASLVIGIAITFIAAAVVAASMVVQRYALSYGGELVPMGPLGKMRKGRAWAVGFMIYVMAILLKVVGFNFAPVTVLASVFTTLLGFNLLFARIFLGEKLTRPKVFSTLLIFGGAVTASLATPFDKASEQEGIARRLRESVKTSYAPGDVHDLLMAPPPGGAFWFGLVVGLVVLSIVFITVCERLYPLGRVAPLDAPAAALDAPPPPWLAHVMSFVYPASMGLNDSIADLCIKGYSSMIGKCSMGHASCDHWVFYLLVALGASAGVASAVWVRVVLGRYETTAALPIVYGSLNAWLFLGGLCFYQEGRAMTWAQLGLAWVGTGCILGGISLPYLWVGTVALSGSLPVAAAAVHKRLSRDGRTSPASSPGRHSPRDISLSPSHRQGSASPTPSLALPAVEEGREAGGALPAYAPTELGSGSYPPTELGSSLGTDAKRPSVPPSASSNGLN